MIEGILTGLTTALTLQNLGWVAVGCVAGTVIGMIPGLGPISAIALMIPVSYGLDPAGGLIMMAGVYYGAVFGGSTSAILINAPGVASTVATSFDGYPMARAGMAGRALALAAYASFAGGTLGALILLFFASSIALLALEIQSPEYAGLLLLAMTSVVVFANEARLQSAAALILGLMVGTVGTDQLGGVQRFTFGRMDLTDGVHFVLLVMATFALAEAFRLLLADEQQERQSVGVRDLVVPRGIARTLSKVVGRSSILGFVIGVLPGAGATLASFFAHDLEKRVGDGSREAGVAAPEAANNAACTGSFVPLLSLGIPGSGTTAVLLGVMLAFGLQPGPTLINEQPEIFWGVIASMYVGNLVLLLLNLPLIPLLARMINVPYRMLIPLVVAFSIVGVFLTTFSVFDIGLMLALAVAATVLRWFGFPLAPLLLGFILSGLFEENVRRTWLLSGGELSYLWDRPIALALLSVTLILWLFPALARLWRRRSA